MEPQLRIQVFEGQARVLFTRDLCLWTEIGRFPVVGDTLTLPEEALAKIAVLRDGPKGA